MLDLAVIKQTPGELTTNIDTLEAQVLEKLKEYDPATYDGDVALAKKDRAELNKSAQALGAMRREIMAKAMEPYAYFENKCKKIETDIKTASSNVDEIVKQDEELQKEIKRAKIEGIYAEKDFHLVPLDKIFKKTWLNKSVSLYNVESEIDEIIRTIYANIKIIERTGEDAETVKALYLDNLNIESALQKADELKKNREKLRKEMETRGERQIQAEIRDMKEDASREYAKAASKEEVSSLVDSIMADEDEDYKPEEPKKHCVYLRVTVTDRELALIKMKLAEIHIKPEVIDGDFEF